jgi:hypothetical protein
MPTRLIFNLIILVCRYANVKNETVLFIESNGSIYIKGDTIIIGYRHYDERRVR